MDDNLNIEIQKSYTEINYLCDDINNKLLNYITKAREFVELSEDDYQIEKTWKLNKISLKGYILESDCCVNLRNKGITDYSINDLKNYFEQYEKYSDIDCANYSFAISLYKMIEDIEESINYKITLETIMLSKIIPNISNLLNIDKTEYEKLYIDLKEQLSTKDLNEEAFNTCIKALNDIFHFYINGDIIPMSFLTEESDEL